MKIFKTDTWKENPKFQLNTVEPYERWLTDKDRLIIAFDIETTGLNAKNDKLLSIGLMDLRNKKFVCYDTKNKSENEVVATFCKVIENLARKYKEVIIVGHNIFNFDLDFIDKIVNFKLPFYKSAEQIPYPESEGIKTDIWNSTLSNVKFVDTLIMTQRENTRRRDLNNISLKEASKKWLGITWNVSTKEAISKPFSKEYYEYLKTDLYATIKLFNRLFEPYYWLKLIAVKWDIDIYRRGFPKLYDDLLIDYYGDVYEPDPPRAYGGALNDCVVGFYEGKIEKYDIASLYPTIMLHYNNAWSYKDNEYYVRTALKVALEKRLTFKKEGNPAQLGLKIFINAGYGTLGYKYAKINDYTAAENVVKYGAKILQHMIDSTNKNGGNVIHYATDGLFTFNSHEDTFKRVQSEMPPHIQIEREYNLQGRLLIADKKSYILYDPNEDKFLTIKGKFRNKERIPLLMYALKRIMRAENPQVEYSKIINEIKSGNIDPDLLKFSRKVRKGERSLLELGFKEGEKVEYWIGLERYTRTGRPITKKVFDKNQIFYDYYIDELIRFIPPQLFVR